MSPSPDFSQPTKDLLARRSAMICNNPDCLTVTVGPDEANDGLAMKLGEAAHIQAARPGPRYDPNMADHERADHTNGIWLCANCHTMIDKNNGAAYPAKTLKDWKSEHAEMISALLRSHKSPIAYLRKVTKEGRIAQNIVDVADQHGALFADMALENPDYVMDSIKQLRRRFNSVLREIEHDKKLKRVIQQVTAHLRDCMNHTSQHPAAILAELPALRHRVGQQLKVLRDEYGCAIPQRISIIIPTP